MVHSGFLFTASAAPAAEAASRQAAPICCRWQAIQSRSQPCHQSWEGPTPCWRRCVHSAASRQGSASTSTNRCAAVLGLIQASIAEPSRVHSPCRRQARGRQHLHQQVCCSSGLDPSAGFGPFPIIDQQCMRSRPLAGKGATALPPAGVQQSCA